MRGFALLLVAIGAIAIVAAVRGTYKAPFAQYKTALGEATPAANGFPGSTGPVSDPYSGPPPRGGGGSHPTSH